MEYCPVIGHHCPYAHGPNELRNPIPFGLFPASPLPKEVSDWQALLHHSAPSHPAIDSFKLEVCPDPACKQKPCLRYHNAYDKRRDPRVHVYASLPCKEVYDAGRRKFGNPGSCGKGDECRFAHTKYETCYHPMYYKTQLCREFMQNGTCEQAKIREKREEDDIVVALSSLLASNQRIAEETHVLKTKAETTTVKLHTFRKLVSCHACLKTEKAVYMSCGHILCAECCVQASCPVCHLPVSPLCRVLL